MPTKTVHVDLTPCAVGCLELWVKISLLATPGILILIAIIYALITNGWVY